MAKTDKDTLREAASTDAASSVSAYPCDASYAPSYPCDASYAPSYPCDASYADSVHPDADVSSARQGKGRRGGNALHSKVIKSGIKNDKSVKSKKRKSFRPREERKELDFSVAYKLKIDKVSDVGAFVTASTGESILIPFAEQIGRPKPGDTVSVRFYLDKGDRLTATMRSPILETGGIGRLKVTALTRIGAFLDNGMPKEVLLPFREQIATPCIGQEVLVRLYTDKSGRIAASERIYRHLSTHSPYHEGDRVKGFVYEINQDLGIFVAVDDSYYGLVPIKETYRTYRYGDEIEARVSRVRQDGKLDLLVRDKLYKTMAQDAEAILYELRRCGGFLPYGDRADAIFIEETYAMSKNQFKRALGHLYRNRIVKLDREHDTVTLLNDPGAAQT